MSSTPDDDAPGPAAQDGAGVLSQLPRTRPQRASARRAAAREGRASTPDAPAGAAGQGPAPERKSRSGSTSKRAGAAKRPPAAEGAAAKRGAAQPSASKRTGAAPKAASPSRERRSASAARARAREDEVPSQGFATEGERVSGPVAPPGSAELFATAAEIVSELARAGVSTGERVVRDVLSRLPRG